MSEYTDIYVNKNGDGFKLNELEVYPYAEGGEKVTYTISELPETKIVETAMVHGQ